MKDVIGAISIVLAFIVMAYGILADLNLDDILTRTVLTFVIFYVLGLIAYYLTLIMLDKRHEDGDEEMPSLQSNAKA